MWTYVDVLYKACQLSEVEWNVGLAAPLENPNGAWAFFPFFPVPGYCKLTSEKLVEQILNLPRTQIKKNEIPVSYHPLKMFRRQVVSYRKESGCCSLWSMFVFKHFVCISPSEAIQDLFNPTLSAFTLN